MHIQQYTDEDLDIFWDGQPLPWRYEGEEYTSYWKQGVYFKNWPTEMIGQFPMKGTDQLNISSSSTGELNLLRTALVYKIPLNESNDDTVDKDEWRYTKIEGSYIGGISGTQRLYERIMLPGKYKLDKGSTYLFASTGIYRL